ncbi:hypothetical protein IWW50_003561 [Coemansia erecta]|nr:hypothetical protein GGF43_002879 [Coemansia sp. RSA 2618]KAJ2823950.1 hypothetical protein IWW50_003561 [Coemansia erecta]
MFALARRSVASKFYTRSYATSCIYIGNLASSTSPEAVKEAFAEFGTITGLDVNYGRSSYRYAHLYFGAGEVPEVDGKPAFKSPNNPQPEEIAAVKDAFLKAINNRQTYVLDGNLLTVRRAVMKPKTAAALPKDDTKAFQDGFAAGYARAMADARNPTQAA